MKINKKIARFCSLIAISITFCSTNSIAQMSPFACDQYGYLFQTRDVIRINMQTGGNTLIGDEVLPNALSAGFNRVDNFIWGVDKLNGNIVKIGLNGSGNIITTSYNIGNNNRGNCADVDANGILYIYNSGATSITRVDTKTAPPTLLSPISVTATAIADFAINPVDGFIYAVSSSNRTVYRFNPTTGARTTVGTIPSAVIVNSGVGYGGAYFDASGAMYISDNGNGRIYKIPNSALTSGTFTSVSLFTTATSASDNDGIRCATAPLCAVGSTAPNISPTAYSNSCSVATFDLATINATNTVAGTSLTWHTGSTATNANKLASTIVSSTGTYYAAFYDPTNLCYSSVTTAITVTINALPTTPTSSTSSSSICSGQPVSLTGSCATGTLTWYKDNTSGTVLGTGSPLSQSPAATTNYVATCKTSACESAPSVALTVEVKPVPSAPSISGNTSICSGASSTLTANGCSGTVAWTPGGATTTSITVSPTANTIYSATCTVNGCTSAAGSVTVNVTSSASPRISASTTSVCTGSSVTLTMTNCSAAIVWTPGSANTASITVSPTATTTYSATCGGTAVSACPSGTSITITVNPVPATPSISVSDATICEGSTTTLTATGCTGSILWSNGQSGTPITVSPPATTSYTATCRNTTTNCTSTASASLTVTITEIPNGPTGVTSTSICSGNSTTLSGTCAAGATIKWFSNSGLTTAIASPFSVSPTTTTTYYAVCENTTNTDCRSASSTATVTVTTTPATAGTASASSATICSGASSSLSSSCGSGTVLKWFSDADLTTELLSNVVTPSSTTTYYAACVNGLCKGASSAVTVTVNPSPSTPTVTSPSTTICTGGSYSLASSCASGDVRWYRGVVDASTLLASTTVTPTENTTYVSTCRNSATGCESTASSSVVVSIVTAAAAPAIRPNLAICNGETGALMGSCASGTITWYTDAALTSSIGIGAVAVTPSATTTYYASCVIGSCKSSSSNLIVTVTPTATPTAVSASSLSICQTESTTISGSCSVGTLTLFVDSDLTTPTSNPVAPTATTTYYVSCVNGTCNSAATSITITVTPTPPTPTTPTISVSTICLGQSATLSSSCSSGTLTWYLSSNLTTPLASNTVTPAAAGNYTYYAYCVSGTCKGTNQTISLTVNAIPSASIVTPSTISDCSGGMVTLSAANCAGTINWYENGSTTSLGTGTSFTTPVLTTPAGVTSTKQYLTTCTVNGCISSTSNISTVSILPPPPQPSISVSSPQVCVGGTVTLTGMNCVAPNVLSWSKDGGATVFATGLSVNDVVNVTTTYSAKCATTDAVSCVSPSNTTITVTANPIPSTSSITASQSSLCIGQSTTLSASCGVGENIIWSNAKTGSPITESPITTTTYTAKCVNSTTGCESATFSKLITVNILPTATLSQTNVLCNGASTGSATVTPTSAATPFSFAWSPSGGTAATASGLAAGTYVVVYTDANTCVSRDTIKITQPTTAISADITTQTNVLCKGASTGSATGAGSGGTGAYTYSWSPSGGAAATASGLAAGTYTLTVRDANNCPTTATATITEPATVVAGSITSQTNVSCKGGSNGIVTIGASGGIPPYAYSWSPSGGTTATSSSLAAGSYVVTITDANSCTTTVNVTVTEPAVALLVSITSKTDVACKGTATGSATAAASGGASPYTYAWSNDATTATAAGLLAGAYTVLASDANNCTVSTSTNITEPSTPTNPTAVSNSTICSGESIGLTGSCSSGTPTFYTDADLTITIASPVSPVTTTTYYVVCVDGGGCKSSSASQIVTVNPTPLAPTSITPTTSICAGESILLSASCASGTPTYYSNTSLTTTVASSQTPASSTSYYVSCVSGTCKSPYGTISVTVKPMPASAASSNSPACTSSVINLTTTAVAGATYAWTGPDGFTSSTQNASIVYTSTSKNGTYNLTVTLDGCVASSSTVVACSPSTPLPVTIVSFNAQRQESVVKLIWTVTDESNVNNFKIQKSYDAIGFETIGTIKAQNISEKHSYTFIENSPQIAENEYYRLMAVDFDGKITYSKIIAVVNAINEDIRLYPNPVGDDGIFYVNVKPKYAILKTEIVDIEGNKQTVVLEKMNENLYKINAGKLQRGTYILLISTTDEILKVKFLR